MNGSTGIIPLAHNESYWLLDDAIIGGLAELLKAQTLSTYPSYDALLDALARYAGVDRERVNVTAGSDAAISILTEYCEHTGLPIGLPVPTFYGYERIAEQKGATVIPFYYHEVDGAFIFPTADVLEAIAASRVGCIFLCTPNNPLGSSIPHEDLKKVLDAAQKYGILAVVDEAYFEFGGETSIERLDSQSIVILRTLSKSFGLAGARIGYCMSSPDITPLITRALLPWPVAHPSVVIAQALLVRAKEFVARRRLIADMRDDILTELRTISGVTAYPSATNFILFRVPDAVSLSSLLHKRKIHVSEGSWMSAYDPARTLLSNTIRMAVPSPKHQGIVLKHLRDLVQRS